MDELSGTSSPPASVPPPESRQASPASPGPEELPPKLERRRWSRWWAVPVGLLIAGVVIASILLQRNGPGSTSFMAGVQAVCSQAQKSLNQTSTTPTSLADAVQQQHRLLSAFSAEVTRLSALRPPAAAASNFHAAVADEAELAQMLRSLLARPDYVHLAVTLPTDPSLAPAWLTSWLARSHALAADAQARFAALHIGACKSGL